MGHGIGDGDESVILYYLGRRQILALEVDDDPLDAGAEADARRGRAAQLLDEAVVAATGADGALGAFLLGLELEDVAGVVVEAAHKVGLEGVREGERLQMTPQGGEVIGAGRTEVVGNDRRPCFEGPA